MSSRLAVALACLVPAAVLVAGAGGLGATPPAPAATLAPGPRCEHHAAGWHAVLCDARVDALPTALVEAAGSPPPGALGGPLPGLSPQALVDFYDGRAAFRQPLEHAQGLGPHFNATSCASCHGTPTLGGRGRDVVSDGIVVHGPAETGHQAMSLRKHAAAGHTLEKAEGAVSRLRSPPLYGAGLLDAVPDTVHHACADPDDADGDQVRGLVNRRGQGMRPCRFGQKANEWNLLRFVAGALRDEMGVTSPLNRNQDPDADAVPDPEMPASHVLRLDAFVRHLAPPPRGPVGDVELQGERLFAGLGCTACHRPVLGDVQGAYTDLLLHDMGPALDNGLNDGLANGRHWRTPPLWGLRFRERYLHDERAASIDEVQRLHGGEAATASRRYLALPAADRAKVDAFLRSL